MREPVLSFLKGYLADGGEDADGILNQIVRDGYSELEITDKDAAAGLHSAVRESELIASRIFASDTHYCFGKAAAAVSIMLHVVLSYAEKRHKRKKILVARNVSEAFLEAASYNALEVEWLYPMCRGAFAEPRDFEEALARYLENTNRADCPVAFYITTPGAYGNIIDIYAIARICNDYGVLLVVDNSAGAYLAAVDEALHPIAQGAHIAIDAVPTFFHGAEDTFYLHLSYELPKIFSEIAEGVISVFATTFDRSYIAEYVALDLTNEYIENCYKSDIRKIVQKLDNCKETLANVGIITVGDEPARITIMTKPYGYLGGDIAKLLRADGILCGYYDSDFASFSFDRATLGDIEVFMARLLAIPKNPTRAEELYLGTVPPVFATERQMTFREARRLGREQIPIEEAEGRALAEPLMTKPGGATLIVPGEIISSDVLLTLEYFGVRLVYVIK